MQNNPSKDQNKEAGMAYHQKTCKESMQHGLIKCKQQQSKASFKAKAKAVKAWQGVGRWLLPRPTLGAPAGASNRLKIHLAKNDGQIDPKPQNNLLVSKCD